MNEKSGYKSVPPDPQNWDDLRLFVAVARNGGLSQARSVAGSSAATLGRRMADLEQRLNRDLFVRHDRGYTLTPDGQELLTALTPVEAQLTRILANANDPGPPVIKISAGSWTTLALISRLGDIAGTPADVCIQFLAGEQRFDIARRATMIGFRNQRPTDPGLAGRRLAQVEFAPYAISDAQSGWIQVLSNTPSARWVDQMVRDRVMCQVNTPRNSLDLAIAGAGTAVLPTFVGDAHPTLHRQGPVIQALTHDQWLVTHDDDRHIPAVRRVLDRIYALFSKGSGGFPPFAQM